VGEKVQLKLQPYAQKTVINRPYPKLAYKYFGPYTVLKLIGQVAYQIELPPVKSTTSFMFPSSKSSEQITHQSTQNYPRYLLSTLYLQNQRESSIEGWSRKVILPFHKC
jgi:hypothetical protein